MAVNLGEVAAQINRVGNAVGIFDGTTRILMEEWQKLVPLLNGALNDYVGLSARVAELEKNVEKLTPKSAAETKTE